MFSWLNRQIELQEYDRKQQGTARAQGQGQSKTACAKIEFGLTS